jgi:rubredoxin
MRWPMRFRQENEESWSDIERLRHVHHKWVVLPVLVPFIGVAIGSQFSSQFYREIGGIIVVFVCFIVIAYSIYVHNAILVCPVCRWKLGERKGPPEQGGVIGYGFDLPDVCQKCGTDLRQSFRLTANIKAKPDLP